MTAPTFTAAPIADQFRPRDIWRGPDGRLYMASAMKCLPACICLRPLAGGRHTLMRRDEALGFQRIRWGGER